MEAKATALLTNWKCPNNVHILVDLLKQQTVPVELFLWNNGDPIDVEVDMKIDSSSNLQCWPRWFMAQYASTPYVFTIDDDLMPFDNRVVEKCIDRLGSHSGMAIGYEGVTLLQNKSYFDSCHVQCYAGAESSVDILKGRFIFTRKETAIKCLRGIDSAHTNARIEDDILFSSTLDKKILPATLAGSFANMGQGGNELWKQPEHKPSREQARTTYFGI